jgi:hypothetical protein
LHHRKNHSKSNPIEIWAPKKQKIQNEKNQQEVEVESDGRGRRNLLKIKNVTFMCVATEV